MNKLSKLKLEAIEKENGGVNVIVDADCDLEFATLNFARIIYDTNNRVNDSGCMKCKNGFWLCVREMVDKMIADEAGVKND